ncbi:hypothetical protein LTR06_001090 [Exophiala xenobiotica]|nr:hypothetical protein LTR06_001090 [Exophiala xenobiotica]
MTVLEDESGMQTFTGTTKSTKTDEVYEVHQGLRRRACASTVESMPARTFQQLSPRRMLMKSIITFDMPHIKLTHGHTLRSKGQLIMRTFRSIDVPDMMENLMTMTETTNSLTDVCDRHPIHGNTTWKRGELIMVQF